ncbi:MAG: thioredoxin family protein [Desulfobacterales bacterium]|nr:thioredoxin family protein [Desulfobacterales bacterium]
MKSIYLYAALLISLCLVLPFSYASAGSIKWYSYNEGLDMSKEKGKKVFLHFYADWCGYCKKMAQETFKDPSVISYLNEQYIPVRVNSDMEKKLAARFGVRGLPVTWLLSEKGEKIANVPGFIPADTFITTFENLQAQN